jgi:hypothetical protein
MATEQKPICVPFPKPRSLKIRLPFGGSLDSVVDISKGPPTDCTLIHGLMLQLAPALAGMECFLKVLKFIKTVKDLTNPADIIGAAAGVGECLNVFVKIPLMIVDILKLIVAYLKCIIEAVRSVLAFQVGINLGDAEGNPAVSLSLDCAQDNAAASMSQLREILAAIQPLLQLVGTLLGLAEGTPLPDPAKKALNMIPEIVSALDPILAGGGATVGVPGTQDTIQTLDNLKTDLEKLEDSLDALG